MRVLTAAILLSLPLHAAAASPSPAQTIAVTAPSPSLPAVEITVGYPGGYVPVGSVPVEVRAKAGAASFDGTISFRFPIRSRHSIDTSIAGPVRLAPGQSSSWRTFGHILPGDRNVEIQWRDAALEVVGTARSGALHAEEKRALRVTTEPPADPAPTFAVATYAVAPEQLPAEAQWYAGFAAIVLPTATWLDLPVPVREAIFGSGIFTVFVGTPRTGQTIGERDRVLLPVTFEPGSSSYAVPWPYAPESSQSVATTMSWRADEGTSVLGRPEAPYIVTSGFASAAWVADELPLARPFPAMESFTMTRDAYGPPERGRPSVRQILRSRVPMIVTILAALLAVALWVLSRRAPRYAVVAVALVASLLIVGAESRIRPLPDRHDVEIVTPLSAGLVERYRGRYSAGPTPLPEESRPGDLARTSIGGTDGIERAVEIRGPNTAPGAGRVAGMMDYEAILRWTSRREPGTAPNVRVLKHDEREITIQYDSPEPVNEVFAAWGHDGRHLTGSVTVPERTSGTATVRAGRAPWQEGASFTDTDARGYSPMSGRLMEVSGVRVGLIHRTRAATRELRWSRATLAEVAGEPLHVSGALRRSASEPGTIAGLFVLPVKRIPAGPASVSIPYRLAATSVTLTWPAGSAQLTGPPRDGHEIATRAFPIPAPVLRQIAASGGAFQVSVSATGDLPASASCSIELGGKP